MGDPLLPPPVLVDADADELASAPIGADAAAPSCGDGDDDALVDAGGSGGGRRRLSCWTWADSIAAGD